MKVQVLLSDVAEDGGAFCVVPRTHHRADTDCDDPAFHPARSAGYLGKVDEPVPEAVKMALPAGTIVIFDTHLHHTALANTSGVDREPHDHCWHLGCILPRVPAMIVDR